ncbi:MAG: hypothetical protein JXQ73_12015 [Phycisphaerae bacterium]|nr:hypothetical protein [Phycisphaerae bacterium]
MVAGATANRPAEAAEPIDIGARLELMVDDYLIDRMTGGAELLLHHPTPREIVINHDAPWEGSGGGYHAIFRDGDIVRMYYHAWQITVAHKKLTEPHPIYTGYAESKDGIHWTKPNLGLFEINGTKNNNIVWIKESAHDFTPFKDANPNCAPDAKYKTVACAKGGLYAFKSPDAIHFSPMGDKPVMTGCPFDTQNVAFWDTVRKEYRAYVRDFDKGCRGIKTATSKDFIHWTTPVWIQFPGAPREQLYTNQVCPYYRAPHLFIGFPSRYIERGWSDSMKALPELEHRQFRASAHVRYGTAITEGLLMTSRDGLTFKRWGEAFLRPGPERPGEWKYGDNYIAWHVVETDPFLPGAPRELSLYATEGYWTGTSSQLRRYTLRIDGFVSVNAPLSGGEFVTKPLTFTGAKLVLNFSTSVAGGICVEIQTPDGKPIDGYALADCSEVFGDAIDRLVTWKGGGDVSKLAGKPVRLRFALKDADLYSLQFRP